MALPEGWPGFLWICSSPKDHPWNLLMTTGDRHGLDPTAGDHEDCSPHWYRGVAGATDVDGDGYDECLPIQFFDCDCDDNNVAVNPGATEEPANGVDDDCDLADGVHQKIWEDMNDWTSDPPTAPWSTTGTKDPDRVTLAPGEVLSWSSSRNARFGYIHVVIDAATAPSGADGTCLVELTTTPIGGGAPTTTSATLIAGTKAYPLSNPEVTITQVKVDCSGATGGTAGIDWLVVQNSDVPFPPATDLDVAWWDTDMPEGGYNTHVVLRGGSLLDGEDSPYDTLFGAGDVSGFARYEDGTSSWVSINGDPTVSGSFLYQDVDMNAHDIAWLDDGSTDGLLLGVTANHTKNEDERGLRGQLLSSSDLGQTWTPLANGYSSGSSDPAVAATRRKNPYGKTDRPGGRLIQPTDTGQAFMASQVGGEPALVLLDSAGTLCTVDSGGVLPEASNWDAGEPHDLLVALAWAQHPISSEQIVFTGYRQRDLNTTSGEHSLFRCTWTGEPTCSDTPTCGAISGSEGLDVADLEVGGTVTDYAHVYVADFGRRDRNDGGTSTCLDPAQSISAGDLCGPRVWRWDAKIADYTGASDTVVDIVTPVMTTGLTYFTETPLAVTGLNISPGTDWLTAFTGNGHAGWYSSASPAWRVSLCEAEGIDSSGYPGGCTSSAGWISLADDKYFTPGYTTADDTDDDLDGEYQRETVLDPSNTWMADQALPSWQADLYDGVVWQADAASPRMLIGNTAFGLWAWHEPSPGALGPESTALDGHLVGTVDEDTAIGVTFFDNAGDLGSTTWQGTVVRDVGFGWDGRVWSLDLDNGFVSEDEGSATRAVRPPQLTVFGAGGQAVATATHSNGDDGAVWIALNDKSAQSGATLLPPEKQGILRSEDGGDTFCYQGVIEEGDVGDGPAIHRSIEGDNKFVGDKADEVFHRKDFYHQFWPYPLFDSEDWLPCDNEDLGDPYSEGTAFRESMTLEGGDHDMSWGNPQDLEALDENVALATFGSYLADEDLDGLGFTTTLTIPGRVGYTLDGGATWHTVDFADAEAACTVTGLDLAEDLFGKDTVLHLVDDSSWYTSAEDWRLDFFLLGADSGNLYLLGGQDCALWRVTLSTTAGPTTTTSWSPVTIPTVSEGCTVHEPSGFSVSPWQDRLLIWGGYSKSHGNVTRERGGLCLMDFDGSNAVGALDPADGYRFSIKQAAPNPLVQDQWVVTPFVDDQIQDQCAREWSEAENDWATDEEDVYDACDVPVPFVYQRRSPGSAGPNWIATDLGIDGLHSLQGTELDLRVEATEGPPGLWTVDWAVLYGTTGTGTYRGVGSW